MAVTVEDIHHIAHLARLKASEEDAQQYAEQLSRIMLLVEQMNEIDTALVAPLAHPQGMILRLRDDEVTEHDHRDAHLALAPESDSGLYLVPQVID